MLRGIGRLRAGMLGSELVTNGTFTTNTTGWTASGGTLSVDTARLKILAGAVFAQAYQAITTVVGNTYRLSVTVTNGDATSMYFWVDTEIGLTAANYDSGALSNGTHTGSFVATATTTYIKCVIGGDTKFAFFDDVSVRS